MWEMKECQPVDSIMYSHLIVQINNKCAKILLNETSVIPFICIVCVYFGQDVLL